MNKTKRLKHAPKPRRGRMLLAAGAGVALVPACSGSGIGVYPDGGPHHCPKVDEGFIPGTRVNDFDASDNCPEAGTAQPDAAGAGREHFLPGVVVNVDGGTPAEHFLPGLVVNADGGALPEHFLPGVVVNIDGGSNPAPGVSDAGMQEHFIAGIMIAPDSGR
jgi:hypothetical protein